MTLPLISIVMPCYNAAAHLARSVGSVQAQDHGAWELLAVDDGSTDDTWRCLEDLARQDARIRPLRQRNAGAAAARNHGIRSAQGRYLAFLDSDDTWDPRFLAALCAALEQAPEAGLAYCGWQNIGLGGARDKPYVPPDYEQQDKVVAVLRTCPWPIHAVLCRTALVVDAGGFDESLSSCMDYDLWLRLAPSHGLVRVPQVLAYYHHHGTGQITSNRVRIAFNHLRAQQKFLASHGAQAQRLGRRMTRELTYGEVLHRGYEAYWRRDLGTARALFRVVMRHGYGSPRDWLRMLPSWLPLAWHRKLVTQRDGSGSTAQEH